ncbi:MAG: RNA-binding S4 domain-containing protein [Bacilli bacterium]|nr:RNA-binding S4 domain-containing protein [Bacilli bacterium]
MKEVSISTEYITVGQLLKYMGAVSNGSETKTFLSENVVEIESNRVFERGKKLYPGVVLSINGHFIKVVAD